MQLTPSYPNKSLRQLGICTPIGTEGVRLQGDEVIGRWASLRDYFGPNKRLLVEDFVNSAPEPEEIRRFTNLYAPLEWKGPSVPEWAMPTEGMEFRFGLEDWRSHQSFVRRIWDQLAEGSFENASIKGLSATDGFEFRDKQLLFRTRNLKKFLEVELLTAPLDRIRKCCRPGCETPYFVAPHLSQQYCSTMCSAWSQAEWKKKWWDEKGPEWRKKQKQKKLRRRPKGSKMLESE
jgi:hypothetical protein